MRKTPQNTGKIDRRKFHKPGPKELANLAPPFQPGISGNPGGRPPEIYRPAYRKLAKMALEEVKELNPAKLESAEAIARRNILAAEEGSVRAAIEAADRSDGRVPFAVTGPNDEPLFPAESVAERVVALLTAAKARRK